ncbi:MULTISPECIES: phosphotransferase [unclassified Flavobacterium]|uniref:phosphotransferase n=1 Tax=unclassified Flavobacterium TaxID=196869 RepID=UPI003F9092EE
MTQFPVTSSTLSATALRQMLIEKYGLSQNCTCQLYRTGMNHTYFITNNEAKYVLRVYCHSWRSKTEIVEEIQLLQQLKAKQLSVSYPIADTKGAFIQELNAPEGIRYAVLFSFAEGGKMRFMDTTTCFEIGVLMANIHNITIHQSSNRIHYNVESLLEKPYQYALNHFPESNIAMQYIKGQIEKISHTFEKIDYRKVPEGIVHLDIWYDNMSVTEQNEITFFDFDFCGTGILVLDVAYFCKQLFHIESNKADYEVKKEEFLKGYQSSRLLSQEEIKLIPEAAAAIWVFYLGVQSQRFDWSNIFLTENYLTMYVGRMQAWLDYNISFTV